MFNVFYTLFEHSKCFRKTGCESLPCHELFSCKVFQEFMLGLDLFRTSTSGMSLVI